MRRKIFSLFTLLIFFNYKNYTFVKEIVFVRHVNQTTII